MKYEIKKISFEKFNKKKNIINNKNIDFEIALKRKKLFQNSIRNKI